MINWAFSVNSSNAFQECLRIPERFLNLAELNEYRKFKIPKRKMEWLFSRWVVKKLVAGSINNINRPAPSLVNIRKMTSGVPYIDIEGMGRVGWLSFSHSNNGVFAAFSTDNTHRFGVDLEYLEEREPLLIEDYFTDSERKWVNTLTGEKKMFLVNLIWSAKEAYLKAVEIGLQMDTRRIEIQPFALEDEMSTWSDLGFRIDQKHAGEWRLIFKREAQFVLTMCYPVQEEIQQFRLNPE